MVSIKHVFLSGTFSESVCKGYKRKLKENIITNLFNYNTLIICVLFSIRSLRFFYDLFVWINGDFWE